MSRESSHTGHTISRRRHRRGGLRRLVDEQIRAGIDGFVPVAHGESPTVSVEEHIRIIKIVVEETRKRVPVIAGRRQLDPRTIELTREARAVGADATLQSRLLQPAHPGRLFRHFKAIADAAGLPIVSTTCPGAPVRPSARDHARLCEVRWLWASRKHRLGPAAAQIISRVVTGWWFCQAMMRRLSPVRAGAQGCISVVSNVAR